MNVLIGDLAAWWPTLYWSVHISFTIVMEHMADLHYVVPSAVVYFLLCVFLFRHLSNNILVTIFGQFSFFIYLFLLPVAFFYFRLRGLASHFLLTFSSLSFFTGNVMVIIEKKL